jgi:F-type H+-transporting ATPase subunit b
MNALVLLAADDHGGQVEQIAQTFGVAWPHLIAQIISFSLVCLLLHRFAYKPVLAKLEERRRTIADGLANSEKIKAELARTEALRQEILSKANDQAAKMIEEAKAAAARLQEQETRKAAATAAQIIANAEKTAERNHDKMLTELKREVGRLVVTTTATVTGKILTPEDQARLAKETAEQLAN